MSAWIFGRAGCRCVPGRREGELFPRGGKLCYDRGMLNAYVGIASKHGLSAFRLERPDTRVWACRLAAGDARPPRVAFWAVLPDQVAARISWLLLSGARREALHVLGRCAREVGRLLPGDEPLRH